MHFSKMKITIFCILLSLNTFAVIEFPIQSPSDRFTEKLTKIESLIEQSRSFQTDEEKMNFFDKSEIRDLLTDLQSLFRIYSAKKQTRFSALAAHYESAKEFEDLISKLNDYKLFAKNAAKSESPTLKEKYNKLLQDKLVTYTNFLKNSSWFKTENSQVNQIRRTLFLTEWPTLEEDRNYLLYRMANNIGKVKDNTYEFADMENGVHEFKRDIRRLSYFNTALGGLIQPDSTMECTLSQATPTNHINKNPSSYICKIPECLLTKLVNAERAFSIIKSQGVRFESTGKEVPKELIERAKNVWMDLISSNIFSLTEFHILSCQTKID